MRVKKKGKALTNNRDILLTERSSFQVAEACKSARTNIMFALAKEKGSKTIVMTSAVPGEGKTISCANTAIAFAQTGAKVILIDADMRKPKAGKTLSVDDRNGLSNILGGFNTPEEMIVHTNAGIDCIPAGHTPPNPIELLGSDTMRDLLETLKSQYDYVFIDTPPVTLVADAQVLATMVTGVVLVVRENYSTHAGIDDMLQALKYDDIHVLGIIFNNVRESGGLYRKAYQKYGRYKSYAYHSYYGLDENQQAQSKTGMMKIKSVLKKLRGKRAG